MKKTKVRFNLGAGANYMKWKIDVPGKEAIYLAPDLFQLRMTGCTLRNQPAAAAKIHAGAAKSVCAWILCDLVEIMEPLHYEVFGQLPLSYNPRTQPNWLAGAVIADNLTFPCITSVGNKLFIQKNKK
jgi:hypothetical protein